MNMVLNDVCEVYSGYALKSFNGGKEGFPVIKIGNILTDGRLSLEDCQYTTETVNTKYYSQKDDVYVALSGATTGKIGLMETDESYVINQRVGVVRRKDKKIPSRFIKYFLLKQTERILQEAAGCAQPNISPKQIGAYTFPSFSSEKMEEITRELDKVTNVIQYRYKQNNLLDCLIKARFVEMFGPISHIGKVVSGATPKTTKENYWDGDNIWITPAELSDKSFIVCDSDRKITDEGVKSCAVNLLPVGTVILSSRAPIGKVAIAGVPMYCNQGFKNIIPNEKINSIYLFELLSMETKFLNSLGRGATFKEISKQIVESINVKVPPIQMQEQFADFVKQIDKSKVAVQKALDEAQLLFDSLMQEYFG